MSDDSVELVKRTLAALQRALDAYWRDPQPPLPAYDAGELWPEWEEWFALVHPDVEWRTIFVGDTFHGHRDCVRVWSDFLRWWRDYRVTLEEIEDLGGGHVFMVLMVSGQPQETDARVNMAAASGRGAARGGTGHPAVAVGKGNRRLAPFLDRPQQDAAAERHRSSRSVRCGRLQIGLVGRMRQMRQMRQVGWLGR